MKKRKLNIKKYSNNNWMLCIDFVFLINTNWKYGIYYHYKPRLRKSNFLCDATRVPSREI